jgi:hypothetical protein
MTAANTPAPLALIDISIAAKAEQGRTIGVPGRFGCTDPSDWCCSGRDLRRQRHTGQQIDELQGCHWPTVSRIPGAASG